MENEKDLEIENEEANEKEEETKEVKEEIEEKEEETNENKKESKRESKKQAKENEKFQKEIDSLKSEIEEQKDKYLRLVAEYDNFRRRAKQEREATYSDAYADALEKILPVMDDLERAAACENSDADSVLKGVQMTLSSFKNVFEKLGIEEIEAAPGTKFDPMLHNAVMHSEDENFGENEIVQVLAKGYKKGDKVLRHSMVMVAN